MASAGRDRRWSGPARVAPSLIVRPNAGGEPRPIAGATQERPLSGVGSSAWFGYELQLHLSADLVVVLPARHGTPPAASLRLSIGAPRPPWSEGAGVS